MNSFAKTTLIMSISIALSACERTDYTTWQCESTDSPLKTKFILNKSKLIIKNEEFMYCGSLGQISYFDIKCLGVAGSEKIQFNPNSGQLSIQGQRYDCKVL